MKLKKLLVANRGEIAIRIIRASNEIGLETVAIYTYEDRYSLHRYKSDESYQIGADEDPLKPYLDIEAIIEIAKETGCDALHPGYGFLSENPLLVKRCKEEGITFVGPHAEAMEALGNKVNAKEIALRCKVPTVPASIDPLTDISIAKREAERIGFPVILKAASGGGGRGMRVIWNAEELNKNFNDAKNEAKTAFGDDTVFLEKFIEEPKHIEVQVLGDSYGNRVHLYERDCSVQRRFQKVVEVAPAWNLDEFVRGEICRHSLNIADEVGYVNAGTVEFLVDKNGHSYFMEVNPRIQVEHTVTEMVTGVDLVKSQIYIAAGYRLSDPEINIQGQDSIKVNGYAIQCRITTEDPKNDFRPDYGTIMTFRSGSGFGVRLDEGSVYQGMKISPFFDSLLVKVSVKRSTLDGAVRAMDRTLREFRIRGVKQNIPFLINIINHPVFLEGKTTVNFIKAYPEVLDFFADKDRATKMVRYLGEIVVNGNPDVKFTSDRANFHKAKVPDFRKADPMPKGTKDILTERGPEGLSKWLLDQKEVQFTDTTMRDAHQSLLATRMRTFDMLQVAESYSRHHPEIFSMEMWGGATFDVCMRFLTENPWSRLQDLRAAMPNVLFQMLLRGSNAVGYTAYPDNLIERFIIESAENGMDVFRIFDSLNWLKAMEVSIDTVRNKTNSVAEVCVCYTGDILDPTKKKYNLNYYLTKARQIEEAGAHILAIKDMAGLLTPMAAKELITALKETVKIPIHLHTHDTSSLQAATYLMAIDAGVDVVDVALGGMSGLTSQPNFNAVVEMLKFHERKGSTNIDSLNQFSDYWETVREYYYPFESGLKAGAAQVFEHEIPGGQYSNLRPQAEALGLGDRFDEIKKTYAEVNELFGDVVKVTPSSKVVGDMALFMMTNGLTAEDVLTKGKKISFPQSVQAFFKGDLGQPDGGFPKKVQKVILKDVKPYEGRPNEHLSPVDFESEFKAFKIRYQKGFFRALEITDFLSWKLYPKVYEEALDRFKRYGDISKIPTKIFFYGLKENEETIVEIGPGKKILVKLLSVGPPDETGTRTVFFMVNGQTRNVHVKDRSLAIEDVQNEKADPDKEEEIGAPLQGLLSKVLVKKGEEVKKNQPLFVLEAMKMETTVTASNAGKVEKVILDSGSRVEAEDLILIIS